MSSLLRALFVCASLCSGCAAGDRLLAGRNDYALYRETRLATTQLDRLGKSHRYLREEPEGRFRPEVEAWFRRVDPQFFSVAYDRPSLLRAYLRELPDGPHAKAAKQRLEEFALLNQYRARHAARERARALAVEDALTKAREDRALVVSKLTELARLLAGVRSFGAVAAELGQERLSRLGMEPLTSHCGAKACLAQLSLPYAIPEQLSLSAREARVEVVIDMQRGKVFRVSVAGTQLFSRLSEAVDRAPVKAGDMGARIEALARSAQVLGNAIEGVLPTSRCDRQPVAPSVLTRECAGVRFELRAATEPGGEDRIEVFAAKPQLGAATKARGAGR